MVSGCSWVRSVPCSMGHSAPESGTGTKSRLESIAATLLVRRCANHSNPLRKDLLSTRPQRQLRRVYRSNSLSSYCRHRHQLPDIDMQLNCSRSILQRLHHFNTLPRWYPQCRRLPDVDMQLSPFKAHCSACIPSMLCRESAVSALTSIGSSAVPGHTAAPPQFAIHCEISPHSAGVNVREKMFILSHTIHL